MRNPRGTILLQVVSQEIVPDSINVPGPKQRLIYLSISFSAWGWWCAVPLSSFSEAFHTTEYCKYARWSMFGVKNIFTHLDKACRASKYQPRMISVCLYTTQNTKYSKLSKRSFHHLHPSTHSSNGLSFVGLICKNSYINTRIPLNKDICARVLTSCFFFVLFHRIRLTHLSEVHKWIF